MLEILVRNRLKQHAFSRDEESQHFEGLIWQAHPILETAYNLPQHLKRERLQSKGQLGLNWYLKSVSVLNQRSFSLDYYLNCSEPLGDLL